MRAGRASVAGESRTCPHCKSTILKSSASCPICHHVLRFAAAGQAAQPAVTSCPLSVEGTIHHPGDGEALEYSIVLEVHDETGKVISRQSVAVGALHRAGKRSIILKVELAP